MSNKGNRFHFVRDKSSSRRAMLLACGAVSGAAVLSFMAPNAHAQTLNTWTSSSSGNWSTGTNWLGGTPPAVTSDGNANLEFDAAGTYTANNDLGAFPVYNMTFDAGNGTTNLTGGDINLSWPLAQNNPPTFRNLSTNPVTINNNVNFEAPAGVGGTEETFVSAPGSTTTFNGTINLTGGSQFIMTNGMPAGTSAAGGTMIWTQPVHLTNVPASAYSGYFPFRIKEGTFEMGGYTVDDGSSDGPVVNVDGVNTLPNGGGVNNGASSSLYIGSDDAPGGGGGPGSVDVVAFYLIAAGDALNWGPEIGNAGTTTIGGLNTSGTVTFNNYFHPLNYTDQRGDGQTIYYSAAAGGTVLQNFQLIGSDHANIDKIGAGTWIIAAGGINPNANDGQAFTGDTIVRDGTLELSYDDTGTNMVTLPSGLPSYYASGTDGGSLGFNAPTNANVQLDTHAVQLGDSGTLATDNIALLTLIGGDGGPRHVLHNISVNNDNPSGTTTIGVGDSSTGDFSGNILLNKSVVLTGGTGGVANFSGNITGIGGITAGGIGTVDLSGANGYAGTTSVSSGSTLISAVTGALPSGTHVTNNGALVVNGNATLGSLNGTGTLVLSPASGATTVKLANSSGLATMGGLIIAPNAALDITNNHFILSYLPGTQATVDASVRSYIISGRAGGTWTGTTGINSSVAALPANSHYAIGYADGADGKVAGLSSGQIEVKYTLLGDADLDGAVTGSDFTALVGNLGKSGRVWDQGDFDYDGSVTGSDFTALVGNLGKSATGAAVEVSAADYVAIDAFAAANGLMADVPEPASASLALIAGLGLLHRRRVRR
jgi:hypothetical protein